MRPRVLGALLSVLVGCLLATACGAEAPRELAGSRRMPFPEVGGHALPDVTAAGAPMALRADADGLLLVYFGYTSCPDVCPTTLSDVRTALGDIGDDRASHVDLAMITVDPERDTDEVMAGYVDAFVTGGRALRTTDDVELRAAADDFGVVYEVTTNDQGEVEVVHSGSLFGVDDAGRLLVTWPFGTPAADLAGDLELLLESP